MILDSPIDIFEAHRLHRQRADSVTSPGIGFKIMRLEVTDLFGQNREVSFHNRNLIIGPNGSGKTAVLELIAVLTGPDDADFLLDRHRYYRSLMFGTAVVHIECDGRVQTFEVNSSDPDLQDKILQFKSTLPGRTSFILHEADYHDILVSDDRNLCRNVEIFRRNFAAMDFELPVRIAHGRVSTYQMGSGAERIMNMSLRLPCTETPIIWESPEQSLSVEFQRTVCDILVENAPTSQIFLTTHSPCVYTGAENNQFECVEIS